MGLTAERIADGMAALVAAEPRFAEAQARLGPPEPRIRPRGYETLLRAIVSQQVSTAAAASIWRRLEAGLGNPADPAVLAGADPEALRAMGLSRQKAGYARDLAAHVLSGALPLDALPEDDEAAIRLLSSVRGLGRWSAEIYLLFAEGRADAFPAGDLALQVSAGRLLLGGERPGEKALRALAEPWRPHRGVAALFLWHAYNALPV
ncbi:MAG: DNA-3-methyladenine glycosylase family protein [Sphingomonadaceae bacterium]